MKNAMSREMQYPNEDRDVLRERLAQRRTRARNILAHRLARSLPLANCIRDVTLYRSRVGATTTRTLPREEQRGQGFRCLAFSRHRRASCRDFLQLSFARRTSGSGEIVIFVREGARAVHSKRTQMSAR